MQTFKKIVGLLLLVLVSPFAVILFVLYFLMMLIGFFSGQSYGLTTTEQIAFVGFLIGTVGLAVFSLLYGAALFHQQKIQQIWK